MCLRRTNPVMSFLGDMRVGRGRSFGQLFHQAKLAPENPREFAICSESNDRTFGSGLRFIPRMNSVSLIPSVSSSRS
jgi:hypothetical protein